MPSHAYIWWKSLTYLLKTNVNAESHIEAKFEYFYRYSRPLQYIYNNVGEFTSEQFQLRIQENCILDVPKNVKNSQ